MLTLNRSDRSGTTAVEAAVVLPVTFLMTAGLFVGGVSVFRYLQVACQAREAARWASVRGGDYQKDSNVDSPTAQVIFDQAVAPFAAAMDPSGLTAQVQWVDQSTTAAQGWDGAAKDVWSITGDGAYVTNTVRVTVRYQWSLGVYADSFVVQSVCEIPMSY